MARAHEEIVFTATIHLDNDAMLTPVDVAGALRKIASKLEREGSSGFYETILDENGNDVGRYKIGPVDHVGEPLGPTDPV